MSDKIIPILLIAIVLWVLVSYYLKAKKKYPEAKSLREILQAITKVQEEESVENQKMEELRQAQEAARREEEKNKPQAGCFLVAMWILGWILIIAYFIDPILADIIGSHFRFTRNDFWLGIAILGILEGFNYFSNLVQSMVILAQKLDKIDSTISEKLDKLSAQIEKNESKSDTVQE